MVFKDNIWLYNEKPPLHNNSPIDILAASRIACAFAESMTISSSFSKESSFREVRSLMKLAH